MAGFGRPELSEYASTKSSLFGLMSKHKVIILSKEKIYLLKLTVRYVEVKDGNGHGIEIPGDIHQRFVFFSSPCEIVFKNNGGN